MHKELSGAVCPAFLGFDTLIFCQNVRVTRAQRHQLGESRSFSPAFGLLFGIACSWLFIVLMYERRE